MFAIIYLAFYLAELSKENEAVKTVVADFGYYGVFTVALISGFNLVVPLPAVTFMPLFLGSGLSFWPSVAVITAGMTIADLVAFFIGRVGRQATFYFIGEKILSKTKKIRESYSWVPFLILLLFASFAPFPNEVLLLPMGFTGYRITKLLPLIFTGNLVFNTLYSSGFLNIFQAVT